MLITHAQTTIERENHPNLGRLITPRHYSSVERTALGGWAWAADNDCFNGYDAEAEERFHRMLERIAGLPGCLFVTAPDYVGDAYRTCMFFEEGASLIMHHGLPVGFVAQDGLECDETLAVPWSVMDALFIGGTDEFKLGEFAAELAREAKSRGKHVHVGRVNSQRRLRHCMAIGADSVDGTQWVRWRDAYLRQGLAFVAAERQLRLDD